VHLYQGTSEQFIADAVQARLANQLADRFFQGFRYKPSPSEVMSWRNSLGAMANVMQLADLRDQGVLVELKLPLSSKRLDVQEHLPRAADARPLRLLRLLHGRPDSRLLPQPNRDGSPTGSRSRSVLAI
jgi:hypothetical protein